MHLLQGIKLTTIKLILHCLHDLELHLFIKFLLYMGTQLLIAIIDARSIVNAYYNRVLYARPGLL